MHEECKTKEEYDELASRGSDSESDAVSTARGNLRKFLAKFCKYGPSCKFQDSTCKRDHSKGAEQWNKEKAKLDSALSDAEKA